LIISQVSLNEHYALKRPAQNRYKSSRPVSVVPVGIRTDAADQRRLAFGFGQARLVTATSDVECLVAHVKADISRLSQ